MAYPSTIGTISNPTANDKLNSPSHSGIERAQSSNISEIQTFIGTTETSTVGTLIYDIRSPQSNGGGHVQTAVKGGTGQTSFTKGDILVAQSASVLSKLAIGTDGQSLVADSTTNTGIKWGIPGATPVTRVYSSVTSQVWNKPSTLSYIVVQLQAPGGSGATSGGGGGGGGGGAFVQKVFAASALPAAVSVLVSGPNTGSILSYFGSLLQVRGGTNAFAGVGAAAGSVLISGDINYNGQAGSSAAAQDGAPGGHSYLGKGGAQGSGGNGTGTAGTGQAGIFGGGGGGGSAASDGTPGGTGGSGGDGAVIIYEY